MRLLRAGHQRGHVVAPGRDSRFAFSSGDFHDPAWMGFGALRACNEHHLTAGRAAAPPARANMEILSVVLAGRLRGIDGDVEAPGVAWTGTGSGLDSPACTPADHRPLHVLQAWIQPAHVNLPPACGRIDGAPVDGRWRVLAAPDPGCAGILPLRQQARVSRAQVSAGHDIGLALRVDRRYWLQVLHGIVHCDGDALHAGDALAVRMDGATASLHAGPGTGCDVLLFDLPG